jgi:hypothetical protein
MSGRRWQANAGIVDLQLAPYEARFLVTGPMAVGAEPARSRAASGRVAPQGWALTTPDGRSRALEAFGSWSRDPSLRHWSGTATYTARIVLPASLAKNACWALDSGGANLGPSRIPQALPRGPWRSSIHLCAKQRS